MSGHEIKELHHARRINAFVAAKARGHGTLRIAQVDQRDRKLLLFQLLAGEAFERGFDRAIDDVLQRRLRALLLCARARNGTEQKQTEEFANLY